MSRADVGVNVGECKAKRFTEKAILIVVVDTKEEVWVPRSQIHDDSEVFDEDNREGNLVVSSWFAAKEWPV